MKSGKLNILEGWKREKEMLQKRIEEQAILTRMLEDLKYTKTESERFILRENEDINRLKLVLGNPQEEAAFLHEPDQDNLTTCCVALKEK